MSRRQKLLVTAAIGALAAAAFGGDLLASLFSDAPIPSVTESGGRGPETQPAGGRAVARGGSSEDERGGPPVDRDPDGLLSYALPLERLPGLPPDAPPGTRLQLWVAWDPPLTERPRIDLLIEAATLERIVEGLSPGTSPTAIVLVHRSAIGDLLYADRYGRLSAVVATSP